MAAVTARCRLNTADKNGATLRDKIEAELERKDVTPAGALMLRRQLTEPVLPVAARPLWEWFWELNSSREAGMTMQPIQYREIVAWSNLMGRRLSEADVRILRAMDAAYVRTVRDAAKDAEEPMLPATAKRMRSMFKRLGMKKRKKGKP